VTCGGRVNRKGSDVEDTILPASLYSAASVRALDKVAIEEFGIASLALMRRAADACTRELTRRWPDAGRATVFCGSGNNAGDGYIIAGMLAEKGLAVDVQVVGDPVKLGEDAAQAYRYCTSSDARMHDFDGSCVVDAGVIVDALLGTGLSGEVRADYARAIDAINTAGRPVLAVDIPSGLSADTGVRLGACVNADVTVTFIGLKQGMFTLDGPDSCGEIRFASLDVPAGVYARVPADAHRLEWGALAARLPVRPKNSHKNRFGHVLVVGGDQGMGGAVAMSGEAALRCGAGLVSVATHPAHVNAVLARRPELMVKGIADGLALQPMLERASVIVLGPGLGRSAWSEEVYRQTMQAGERPMVMDADGLYMLAQQPGRRTDRVLTPHPGEAGVLLQGEAVQSDRFHAVTALQARYGGTVVLKGAGSLIHDGDGICLCSLGNPGMSTAGMGDVLSGVIGGLLAQGLPVSLATRTGVAVHALAGDRCAARSGQRGLVATDLIAEIRKLLNPGI
jgi:hydroxyethylthiazole kinase-like uncharacterized protein yjeF